MSEPADRELPVLRDDVRIYKGPDESDGAPSWTLYDMAGNRFFRVGWLEFECLSRMTKSRTTEDIARAVSQETALDVSADEVSDIMQFLVASELVKITSPGISDQMGLAQAKNKKSPVMALIHNYLFFMVPLFRPEKFLKKTLPLAAPFLSTGFFGAMMILLTAGIFMTLGRIDEFFNTFMYFFTWQGIACYAVTIVAVKIVHELAHAYIATKNGVRVSSMGVAFMVLYPVMFTETTGAWRLTDRRQRVMIGAGGVMAELCLAAVALFAWQILPEGAGRSIAFFVATVSLAGSFFVNLNPLMRFDGYYLLSDLMGVDNMQQRAFDLARWRMRRFLFGWRDEKPEYFPARKELALLLYAYGTWIYRFFLFAGIAWLVYHLFFQPLGFFLMLVEVIWFIALPVVNEVKFWWKGRRKMTLNIASVRTFVILTILLGWLFVPWRSHVTIPAVMQASQYTEVYSPVPARLSKANVKVGDYVDSGATIAVMESPDLAHRISQTEKELAKLQAQKVRESRNETLLRQGAVLDRRIAETQASLTALREKGEQLSIVAPFAGRIVSSVPYLHEQRWFDSATPLYQLVSAGEIALQGYFRETDMQRMKEGATGIFYPDTDVVAPFKVEVTAIEKSNTTTLDWPVLASSYGGPVAVEARGDNGALKPHESIYKVSFRPVNPAVLKEQSYMLPGRVKLRSARTSVASNIWKSLAAFAVREVGAF